MATSAARENGSSVSPSTVEKVEYLIVGGGFSGIGAAAMLHSKDIDDYVLVEKAAGLGGTWFHNTYPGCACDIPSLLYQFGFRLNPDWSRIFAPQAEVRGYLEGIAREFDIYRHTRLETEMREAHWNADEARWEVRTSNGDFYARFLWVGTGSEHYATTPELEGKDTFTGQAFHSSEWTPGYNGSGERVAVVGTGASAVQLVPALVRNAKKVVVFQSSPQWIQPKPDWDHSKLTQAVFRRFPAAQLALRRFLWIALEPMGLSLMHMWIARLIGLIPRLHLRVAIRDRKLRKALTPKYTLGCKRPLLSLEYYPALQQPNAHLVASPAVKITENSVIAADGTEHVVDTIVYATGFGFGSEQVASSIHGVGRRNLNDVWRGTPSAYMGLTVSGFPNLALIWGPNSSQTSIAVAIEAQCRYLSLMIDTMQALDIEALDVHHEVEVEFKRQVVEKTKFGPANLGGCGYTWYLDSNGVNQALWPGTMTDLWRRLSEFDVDDYETVAALAPLQAEAPALAAK